MNWTKLDWNDESSHPQLNTFVLVCCMRSDLVPEYHVMQMQEIPEADREFDDEWWRYWADIDGDYSEWTSDRDQWFVTLWTVIDPPFAP